MKVDKFKTIIYSCVTGRYDRIYSVPDEYLEKFQHICFSERKRFSSSGWKHANLRSPERLKHGHDINRFHKIFSHHVVPECRYSVYLDGNVRYIGSYENLIEQFRMSGAAIAAFRHPQRRTVKEEVRACEKLKKFDSFDISRAEEQLEFYSDEGFDINSEVTANYMLVRDNEHTDLTMAMSLWWSQIFEFTKRDQISLGYALWKTQTPWVFLDDLNGVEHEDLIRVSHRRTVWSRIRRIILKAYLALKNWRNL